MCVKINMFAVCKIVSGILIVVTLFVGTIQLTLVCISFTGTHELDENTLTWLEELMTCDAHESLQLCNPYQIRDGHI